MNIPVVIHITHQDGKGFFGFVSLYHYTNVLWFRIDESDNQSVLEVGRVRQDLVACFRYKLFGTDGVVEYNISRFLLPFLIRFLVVPIHRLMAQYQSILYEEARYLQGASYRHTASEMIKGEFLFFVPEQHEQALKNFTTWLEGR